MRRSHGSEQVTRYWVVQAISEWRHSILGTDQREPASDTGCPMTDKNRLHNADVHR